MWLHGAPGALVGTRGPGDCSTSKYCTTTSSIRHSKQRTKVLAAPVSSRRIDETQNVVEQSTFTSRPDFEEDLEIHRLLLENKQRIKIPEANEERWDVRPPDQEAEASVAQGCPVYVMLPLDTVGTVERDGKCVSVLKKERALEIALHTLRHAGVEGVMVDVWWGIVERAGPQQYDFAAYKRLFHKVAAAGLKVQAVMSFHAAGGNVGDTCKIPLPKWLHEIGDQVRKIPCLPCTVDLICTLVPCCMPLWGQRQHSAQAPRQMAHPSCSVHRSGRSMRPLHLQHLHDGAASAIRKLCRWQTQAPEALAMHSLYASAVSVPVAFPWPSTSTASVAYQRLASCRAACQPALHLHIPGERLGWRMGFNLASLVTTAPYPSPQNLEIFFTDKDGYRNRECLSLGCNHERVFRGRTGLELYRDFYASFADTFDYLFGHVISEVTIGLGPAGELR